MGQATQRRSLEGWKRLVPGDVLKEKIGLWLYSVQKSYISVLPHRHTHTWHAYSAGRTRPLYIDSNYDGEKGCLRRLSLLISLTYCFRNFVSPYVTYLSPSFASGYLQPKVTTLQFLWSCSNKSLYIQGISFSLNIKIKVLHGGRGESFRNQGRWLHISSSLVIEVEHGKCCQEKKETANLSHGNDEHY